MVLKRTAILGPSQHHVHIRTPKSTLRWNGETPGNREDACVDSLTLQTDKDRLELHCSSIPFSCQVVAKFGIASQQRKSEKLERLSPASKVALIPSVSSLLMAAIIESSVACSPFAVLGRRRLRKSTRSANFRIREA